MRFSIFRAASEMTSLRSLLHRSQFSSALFASVLTAVAITVVGTLTVVNYTNHSMGLLGRTIAYNIEAAMVFHDKQAIDETLAYLAKTEEIAEVVVYDIKGNELSQWRSAEHGLSHLIERKIADALLDQPFRQDIAQDGEQIGYLILKVRGSMLSTLLMTTGLVFVAVFALSMLMILVTSRYVRRTLITPLARLSTVARSIAAERNFSHRVPHSNIKELNQLADDFNSLLHEIQQWQGHMQKEHAFLSKKASLDPLTGLPNRTQFAPALAAAMSDASKNNSCCALLFIDCDEFKEINDTYGHPVGDAVLVAIASRLGAHLRSRDLVVRLGGDEFSVLLHSVRHPQDALLVADKMLANLEEPIDFPLLGKPLKVFISIGIAVYPYHSLTPEGMINQADKAMYQAKRARCGKYMDDAFIEFHHLQL